MAGKIIAPISIMAGTISLVVESRCICPSEKGQTLNRLHHPAGVSARWTVDLHDSACSVSGFVSASFPLSSCANCGSKRSSHVLRGPEMPKIVLGGRQFPGVFSRWSCLIRVETKKKSGRKRDQRTDGFLQKVAFPRRRQRGCALGPVPWLLSPARLPADGRPKKVGNSRRWLPPSTRRACIGASSGQWG